MSCSMPCSTYACAMNTSTLTIRLPLAQREMLRQTAGALRKTESEYIRDLLAQDLDAAPLGERLGDLAGSLRSSLRSSGAPHPLKARIRASNWRE